MLRYATKLIIKVYSLNAFLTLHTCIYFPLFKAILTRKYPISKRIYLYPIILLFIRTPSLSQIHLTHQTVYFIGVCVLVSNTKQHLNITVGISTLVY